MGTGQSMWRKTGPHWKHLLDTRAIVLITGRQIGHTTVSGPVGGWMGGWVGWPQPSRAPKTEQLNREQSACRDVPLYLSGWPSARSKEQRSRVISSTSGTRSCPWEGPTGGCHSGIEHGSVSHGGVGEGCWLRRHARLPHPQRGTA